MGNTYNIDVSSGSGGGTTFKRTVISVDGDTTLTTFTSGAVYLVDTQGNDVTFTVPDSNSDNDGDYISIYMNGSGGGSITIKTTTGQIIGYQNQQVINVIAEGITIVSDGDNTKYAVTQDSRKAANAFGIVFYPVSELEGVITDYRKLVNSKTDPDYSDTPTTIVTPVPAGTTALGSWITYENVIDGLVESSNLTLTINLVKASELTRSVQAYFEVYKRDSGGTETLLATSSKTPNVDTIPNTYITFALIENVTFDITDRIVVKPYLIGGSTGSNASVTLTLEGTNNQTRLVFPIATDTIVINDDDIVINNTYTGNLSGATTQEDANDILDALSGGGGGTIQNANLSIQAADEGTVAGDARGANAVDLQTSRNNALRVASGDFAVITGGDSNKATGRFSIIDGGNSNYTSGDYCTIVGGNSNYTSGDYCTIVGGNSNSNRGDRTTIIGGVNCNGTTYSSDNIILGGTGNHDHHPSLMKYVKFGAVVGGRYAFPHIYGQCVIGSYNNSWYKSRHNSLLSLQLTTTSDTPNQIMYIYSPNKISIPTNTKYSVIITIGANDTTNNANSSTYRVIGDLLNNAGTVTWAQEASPITVSQGAGCGTVTVSADNTNKALQVAVTPNSTNTIVWQAKVELVEVQE